MTAYYNDIDKSACAWLRELIKQGLIADGVVDERSITDIKANDLRGFSQCHFFAGISGWSYALRLANWSDNRPVWTASLPCQPFSVAGNQKGKEDERHLLPHFLELVRQCGPDTILGEQVEGAVKHGWVDDLSKELGIFGYETAFSIIPAAAVGAPHIRSRLYWAAIAKDLNGVLSYNKSIQLTLGNNHEEMQQMPKSKAIDRVRLREKISRQAQIFMQGVRQGKVEDISQGEQGQKKQCSKGKEFKEPRDRSRSFKKIQREISISDSNYARKKKGAKIRVRLRFRCTHRRDKAKSCSNDMRNVWSEFGQWSWSRKPRKKVFQYSINRQNRPCKGVCLRKYTNCLLGYELCNVHLGRGCSFGCNEVMDRKKRKRELINDTTRKARCRIIEACESINIANLQINEEGNSNSRRSEDSENNSVNAPHIRQRLYWVASRLSNTKNRNGRPEPQCASSFSGESRHELRGDGSCGDGGIADSKRNGSQRGLSGRKDSQRETIGRQAGFSESVDDNLGNAKLHGLPAATLRRSISQSQAESGLLEPERSSANWSDIEWIYCRDGKHRPILAGLKPVLPVKSSFISISYGIPRRLVCCCHKGTQKIKEEKVNATKTKANTRKILFGMQYKIRAQIIRKSARRFGNIQQTEVLQSGLYGKRSRKRSLLELKPQQIKVHKVNERLLRGVWEQKEASCTSCGLQSIQQHNVKLNDLMSKVSPRCTLETLFCARGKEYMQTLRKASDEAQPLLDSQYPLSKIWRSLDDQEKSRCEFHFNQGSWLIDAINPNETQEARVMRLRGYGNSIVPSVGAEFIKAFMAVQNEQ